MTSFIQNLPRPVPGYAHLLALGVFLLACAPGVSSLAQGLDAEGAIDTIVGSQVETAEEAIAADDARVIAAIENSSEAAVAVRKRFSVGNVRIVFLPDLDEDAAVRAKIEEFETGIAALRESIQGSAIFYHAIDSHRVMLDDIVAVEFEGDDVTIMVAGAKP